MDIVGFTSLSERIGAMGVVQLLHEFWMVVDVLVDHANKVVLQSVLGALFAEPEVLLWCVL